jgi:hypothetical protein
MIFPPTAKSHLSLIMCFRLGLARQIRGPYHSGMFARLDLFSSVTGTGARTICLISLPLIYIVFLHCFFVMPFTFSIRFDIQFLPGHGNGGSVLFWFG